VDIASEQYWIYGVLHTHLSGTETFWDVVHLRIISLPSVDILRLLFWLRSPSVAVITDRRCHYKSYP
jgi:hypothetical protein